MHEEVTFKKHWQDIRKDVQHAFFGIDGNCFKLGNVVYEAVEDPEDDYRSFLACVRRKDAAGLIFFAHPLAIVRIVRHVLQDPSQGSSSSTFRLTDKQGHVWLEFGTRDFDDYYPVFIFSYSPKE